MNFQLQWHGGKSRCLGISICTATDRTCKLLTVPKVWIGAGRLPNLFSRRLVFGVRHASGFQRIADSVASLLESGLNARYFVNRVQKHKVVNHSVVANRGYRNTCVFEFARVGFALVAERISSRR